MSISAITQPAQQFLVQDNPQKYSTNIPRIAKNISKVVLPMLIFYTMSHIPGADAGPLAYASCLAGCAAMGPIAPACWAACLPILALPGP